jgi:hypothetical protein
MRDSGEGLEAVAAHCAVVRGALHAMAQSLEAVSDKSLEWSGVSRADSRGFDGDSSSRRRASSSAKAADAPRSAVPDPSPGGRLGAMLKKVHSRAVESLRSRERSLAEDLEKAVVEAALAKYKHAFKTISAEGMSVVDAATKTTKAVPEVWSKGFPHSERDGLGRGSTCPWIHEVSMARACRAALVARRRCLSRLGKLFELANEAEHLRCKALLAAADALSGVVASIGQDTLSGKTGGTEGADASFAVRKAAEGMGTGPDGLRARLERQVRPLLGAMLCRPSSEGVSGDMESVDIRATLLGYAPDGTDLAVEGDALGAKGDPTHLHGRVPSVLAFCGMVPSGVSCPLMSHQIRCWGVLSIRGTGLLRRWRQCIVVLTHWGWLHVVDGPLETLDLGCSLQAVAECVTPSTCGFSFLEQAIADKREPAMAKSAAPRAAGVPDAFPPGKSFERVSDVTDDDVDGIIHAAAAPFKPWRTVDLINCPPPPVAAERDAIFTAAAASHKTRTTPRGEATTEVAVDTAEGAGVWRVKVTRPGFLGSSTEILTLRCDPSDSKEDHGAAQIKDATEWVNACCLAAHTARRYH